MLVEELLQSLVRKIYTQLLEAVELKDLKAGNVQNPNEVLTLGADV